MVAGRNFLDSLTQAANDLDPPVTIETSRLLDNPKLPNHHLCVIRVPESPEAPHASQGGTQVHVRTGDQNKPINLAKLDQLEYLLSRRQKSETERDKAIDRAMDRAKFLLPSVRAKIPIAWASVIPLYPWRDLMTPVICRTIGGLLLSDGRMQQVPGGFCSVVRSNLTHVGVPSDDSPRMVDLGITDTRLDGIELIGHCYSFERVYPGEIPLGQLGFFSTIAVARRLFSRAARLYCSKEIEKPGFLLVQIGVLGARGHQMLRPHTESPAGKFPDDNFCASRIMDFEAFAKSKFLEGGPEPFELELYSSLAAGFDVDPPRIWYLYN